MTKGTESQSDQYKYRAFGLQVNADPGLTENPFQYVGKQGYYREPELELYLLGGSSGGRYYDPATGRFLSEDPLGFSAGDDNLYRYVGNNPVNATDPSGQGVEPGVQNGNFAGFDVDISRGWIWKDPPGFIGRVKYDRTVPGAKEAAEFVAQEKFAAGEWFGEIDITKSTAVILSRHNYTGPGVAYYAGQGALGLAQGGANLANSATDAAIGAANTPAFLYNWTFGWVLPNIPYIPSSDWSRDLVCHESDSAHSWSKFGGDVAVNAILIARALQAAAAAKVAAAKKAAEEEAKQAAAKAAAAAEKAAQEAAAQKAAEEEAARNAATDAEAKAASKAVTAPNKVPPLTVKGAGKVADSIPTSVPRNWSRQVIENAIPDLERSIAIGRAEVQAFDAVGGGNQIQRWAHNERIVAEENFLRQPRRALQEMR